jgi:putative oxidoreductase
MRVLAASSAQLLATLRIVTAALFMEAGIFHLFHWPASPMPAPPPQMATLLFAAGLLEFVGGMLLIVGLFTRPTSFILSGMMAIAYWGFHAPMGLWPVTNMGVAAILYCFIFLYLAASGPGAWAVDNLRRGDPEEHALRHSLDPQRPVG